MLVYLPKPNKHLPEILESHVCSPIYCTRPPLYDLCESRSSPVGISARGPGPTRGPEPGTGAYAKKLRLFFRQSANCTSAHNWEQASHNWELLPRNESGDSA